MKLTSHVDGKLGNVVIGENQRERRETIAGVRFIGVVIEARDVDDEQVRRPSHRDDIDAMLVSIRIPFEIDRKVCDVGELGSEYRFGLGFAMDVSDGSKINSIGSKWHRH